MRKFLAGVGLGLAAGLIIGVAASGLVGDQAGGGPVVSSSSPGESEGDGRATGATPANADPVGLDLRTGRTHVTPPDPKPRQASKPPQPAPSADGPPAVSTAEMIRAVRKGLADHSIPMEGLVDAASQIAGRPDASPLPFDLIELALARADAHGDFGYEVAVNLAGAVGPTHALLALHRGLDGETKLLWIAYELAPAAANTSKDDGWDGFCGQLLMHSESGARDAGIYLSQWCESPPVRALMHVAERDPNPETRAYALEIVTDVATSSDDPRVRNLITPLILMNALEGPMDARREAISRFEDLGPAAADAALRLIREGGLDDELSDYVIVPVLAAGRLGEAVKIGLTEDVANAAAYWSGGFDPEEEPDAIDAIVPHAAALIGAANDDAASTLLWALAYHGHLAPIEAAAMRTDLSAEKETVAVSILFSEDEVPGGLQRDLERRAVRVLTVHLDPRRSDTQRRRRAAQAAAWEDWELSDPATRAAVMALLHNTARGDPSAWVRGLAQEAIDGFSDDYE